MIDEIKKTKYIELAKEFARYLLVGGSAFLIDTGVLVLAREFIFHDLGKTGILISTALGFVAGLTFNYILSLIFVFKKGNDKVNGKQFKSFVIFSIIGVIGLLMTELGMYFGIKIFGTEFYIVVKIFIAGVVLLWNYIGRKIFIFK